jgi:hypothetical protein
METQKFITVSTGAFFPTGFPRNILRVFLFTLKCGTHLSFIKHITCPASRNTRKLI